jgi:hypothetical protein
MSRAVPVVTPAMARKGTEAQVTSETDPDAAIKHYLDSRAG